MSEEQDESTVGSGLLVIAVGVLIFALIIWALSSEEVSGFSLFLGWIFAFIFFGVILVGLIITRDNWPVRRTTRTIYGDT